MSQWSLDSLSLPDNAIFTFVTYIITYGLIVRLRLTMFGQNSSRPYNTICSLHSWIMSATTSPSHSLLPISIHLQPEINGARGRYYFWLNIHFNIQACMICNHDQIMLYNHMLTTQNCLQKSEHCHYNYDVGIRH